MFPDRRVLLKYLDDYQKKLGINVLFDTHVANVTALHNKIDTEKRFIMSDQHGRVFTCRWVCLDFSIKLTSAEVPVHCSLMYKQQ